MQNCDHRQKTGGQWTRGMIAMVLVFVAGIISPAAAGRWSHFLPGENVRCMQYDTLANVLWLGTADNSLWRFDGREFGERKFEHFTLPGTTPAGLVEQVTALAVDAPRAEVWVGTRQGLFRYYNKTQKWDYYDSQSGLSVNHITALYLDHEGTLWYGSLGGGAGKQKSNDWFRYMKRGAEKWNGRSWERISSQGPASDYVDCITADKAGRMYFGTREAGLCILAPDGISWRCLADFFPPASDPAVTAIAIDRRNHKWLCTLDGVYWLDDSNRLVKALTPQNSKLVGAPVEAVWIETYSEGEIKWFGTSSGVSRLDSAALDGADIDRHIKNFTNQNSGLASNTVRNIAGDRDGNIWFALLQERGVSRLNNNWDELKTADGLLSNFTLAIEKDRRGRLWVGTDLDTVTILNRGKWEKIDLLSALQETCENNLDVTEFLPDGEAMWVASTCGVFKLSPDLTVLPEFRIKLNQPQDFPGRRIFSLAQFQDTLWAGTDAGLARVLLSATGVRKLDQIFLRGRKILALAHDYPGGLYAGTDNGLYVFNGLDFIAVPFPDFGQRAAINSLTRDPGGGIWVGSNDGLAHFNGLQWSPRYTSADGLPDNNITKVAVSPSGVPWCATIKGVAAFFDKKWTAYTAEAGLSDDFVLGIAFGPPEVAWFATYGGGVSRYRKTGVLPETFILENFKIVTDANVTFRFSGYDLQTPRNALRYQYALDDSLKFSPATADTNITLFVEPDGAHRFYVRALDQDGNIDFTAAKLSFYKLPREKGNLIRIVEPGLGPMLDSLRLYIPPAVLPKGSTISVKPVRVKASEIAAAGADTAAAIAFELALRPANIFPPNQRPMALAIFHNQSLAQKFDQRQLAIYRYDGRWILHGGTVGAGQPAITTAITQLDTFALLANLSGAVAEKIEADFDKLTAQPRMLAPQFAEKVTISFFLSRSGEVTAKIYNLAGRLVQRLCENLPMNSGHNALEWNGRDREGRSCPSGMYLICVQAEGRTKTKTVMVVNR